MNIQTLLEEYRELQLSTRNRNNFERDESVEQFLTKKLREAIENIVSLEDCELFNSTTGNHFVSLEKLNQNITNFFK